MIAHEKLFGNPINGLYGVADGHGGYHAAQFCSVNLIEHIQSTVKLPPATASEEETKAMQGEVANQIR